MAQINSKHYPSQPDSYDVWDAGSRNMITHQHALWYGEEHYPVISNRIIDASRRDRRWFRHVNYPLLALELVIQGAVEYRHGSQLTIAHAGMLYVVSHHSDVTIVNAKDAISRKLTMFITGSNVDSLAATLKLDHDQLIKLSNPEEIIHDFRQISTLLQQNRSGVEISSATYQLLLKISADLPSDPAELQPLLEAIRRNPTHSYTSATLAKLCGISEATLRRYFARHFKMSPMRYLQQLRLNLGAELLVRDSSPIKTIALRCGFNSALRFALAFKAHYGVTPSIYRENINKKLQ